MALGLVLGLTAGCTSDSSLDPPVGRPCTDSTDCEGSLVCLTDFPGGYCSEACDEQNPCDRAACVTGMCLDYCTTAAGCRDGYDCISAGDRRVCAPPGQGLAGIGDNCSSAEDCQPELQCEALVAEGSQCTRHCTSVLNCGANAVCVDEQCRRTCDQETDCDANQRCVSTPDGRICEPTRAPSPLGGPCGVDADCEGSLTCLTDTPDGYCTRSCSDSSVCGDGVCHNGFCFSGCEPGAAALDLLFIVDDSGGMATFQQMLINASASLFTSLDAAGTDYRVGIVTTDVDVGGYDVTNCKNRGGLLQTTVGAGPCEAPPDPWITPANVTSPASSFACIVAELGDGGCGFEQPFEALQRAVSDAVNPGFIREGAHLAVVLVTNEDDCSAQNQDLFDPSPDPFGAFVSYRCFEYGIACDGTTASFTNCHTKPAGDGGALYPIGRYTAQLEAVKGSLDRVTLVAVAGPSSPVSASQDLNLRWSLDSSCAGGAPDAQPGIRIAELVDAVSGHFTSICTGYSGAWNPILAVAGTGGECRPGYQCSSEADGDICEPR